MTFPDEKEERIIETIFDSEISNIQKEEQKMMSPKLLPPKIKKKKCKAQFKRIVEEEKQIKSPKLKRPTSTMSTKP